MKEAAYTAARQDLAFYTSQGPFETIQVGMKLFVYKVFIIDEMATPVDEDFCFPITEIYSPDRHVAVNLCKKVLSVLELSQEEAERRYAPTRSPNALCAAAQSLYTFDVDDALGKDALIDVCVAALQKDP